MRTILCVALLTLPLVFYYAMSDPESYQPAEPPKNADQLCVRYGGDYCPDSVRFAT